MSDKDRWVDSLPYREADDCPPEHRLAQALLCLALALRIQTWYGSDRSKTSNIQRASALVVAERRRLEPNVPPAWRRRQDIPGNASLVGAIGYLSLALGAQQTLRGTELGDWHVVKYLRGCEAHLRAVWKEKEGKKD